MSYYIWKDLEDFRGVVIWEYFVDLRMLSGGVLFVRFLMNC